MALTFSKDIDFIYPVYNDSWIEFTSAGVPDYAEITIQDPADLLSSPLVVYPNQSGNFLLNLKEIAKISYNSGRFQFSELPSSGWTGTLPEHKTKVTLSILVYTDGGTETETKAFNFYKGVQQVTEEFSSPTILNKSIRFDYWEGWPFDLQIMDFEEGDQVTVKNVNTGLTSAALTVPSLDSNETFSLVVDNGQNNWTASGFSPLLSLDNVIEIYKNGTLYQTAYIKKHDNCKGVYLRWINSKGGVSYHLFDQYYKNTLSSSLIGTVSRNDFSNADNLTAPSVNLGSEASKNFVLKSTVEKDKLNAFSDLLISPNIEVYTSTDSYVPGFWVPVSVNGSLSMYNKNRFKEVSITVKLPELITMSL